jgi:hypothetical protein
MPSGGSTWWHGPLDDDLRRTSSRPGRPHRGKRTAVKAARKQARRSR